jgi:glycosyltransferase involved in cell wall biosynthesis
MKRANQPSISVVLPTHNELSNLKILIPQIIKTLKSYQLEIIVVDDVSTDGSKEWLAVQHHRHPFIRPIFGTKLRGIGFALHRGYNISKGEVIVSLDADLSLSATIIPRLLARINQGYDLVVGSRHHALGKYEAPNSAIKQKRFISHLANGLIKVLLPIGITDFSLDCRAICRDLWRQLKLQEKTNIWLIEMIIAAAIKKARITEIPVVFKDRRFGVSKLNLKREVLFTGYHVIGLIAKYYYDHLFFWLP